MKIFKVYTDDSWCLVAAIGPYSALEIAKDMWPERSWNAIGDHWTTNEKPLDVLA